MSSRVGKQGDRRLTARNRGFLGSEATGSSEAESYPRSQLMEAEPPMFEVRPRTSQLTPFYVGGFLIE